MKRTAGDPTLPADLNINPYLPQTGYYAHGIVLTPSHFNRRNWLSHFPSFNRKYCLTEQTPYAQTFTKSL